MKFKRVLGFWDLFWVSVGGMVGVAILTFASVTYGYAGPAGILAWVLAGIFSILMALVYAEMVTAFPNSGALVVFPYQAFGKERLARYLAFLEGTGYYLGTLFGIIISAILLGNYIGPSFGTGTFGSFVIAEISLLFVGIINMLGAKVTSRVNLLMSVFFTIVFVIVIIMGFVRGNASLLTPFVSGSNGLIGILYGIPIAILAYGSWTALITIPEETKDVSGIPKALIYSLLVVTVLYSLLVLAVYLNLSPSQMATTYYYYPVLGFVQTLNSATLLLAFQAAAFVAILAVMLILVLSNARILVALGRLNFLPEKINKLSNRAIPFYATILSFLIPMILSAFPTYYYQYVVIGAVVGTGLPRIIDLVAYLKLRGRKDYKPSFRVGHGLLLAAAAFVGLAISEISLGVSDLLWSAVAIIVITVVFVVIEWRNKGNL